VWIDVDSAAQLLTVARPDHDNPAGEGAVVDPEDDRV